MTNVPKAFAQFHSQSNFTSMLPSRLSVKKQKKQNGSVAMNKMAAKLKIENL